jgi:ABC-type nitrate/sulfonate/bicarbonate transport system permease component
MRAEPSDQHATRPVPFRGAGFAPKSRPVLAWLAFALAIAFWQLGSARGWIDQLILPSPLGIVQALVDLAASGDLGRHLAASLFRLSLGWLLGTLAGLAIGTLIGLFSLARSVGIPFTAALFPIPKIALLPLFIIWFGIDEPSKVATILFGTFFPTVIATYAGVDGVSRSLIRMAQSFGVPTWRILARIILPGALPSILAGFRISVSIAIVLLVAAEMIGAQWGIGALVLAAGSLMQTEILLAGVVVLSLIGLSISTLLGIAERRLLRWR